MATMFEKGQSKRYSRVSYGMKEGGEAKKRSKNDDKSEAAEANPYGNTKALDEATKNMRRGGMAESKKMMAKEVAFMKKKKAPKSMIAHEKAEMKGEKKYAIGGALRRKIQENMAKGRAAAARPARNPKSRPMPRPANPRPANPRPTTPSRSVPKSRVLPRPANPRPTTPSRNVPKSRAMPRPANPRPTTPRPATPRPRMKTGGKVKGYYKGGSVDGCVTKGRTKGKIK